jgi:hypothetical protein
VTTPVAPHDAVAPHEHYPAENIEPGMDAVQQQRYDGPAIPVRLDGPVQTHELPARRATSRNLTVADAASGDAAAACEQIGSKDLTRKYLYVLCTGQPIYIGHSRQEAAGNTAGILPVNVPLPMPTGMDIWVRCATAGQSAVVSYWSGNWAD